MGIQHWILGKARKALNEVVPQEENENLVQNDEVEKASYSEHSYKNVQKIREKAKYYGYDVPYLQFPVQKQEKPRTLFVVLGVLYAVALAAALTLSVMLVTNLMLPLISSALETTGWVKFRAWDIFGVVAGLSAIGSFMVWVIVIALAAAIIGVNVFLLSQTLRMFRLSKISMQEMAKGYEIGNMIFGLIAIIVSTLVVGIAILVMTRENIKPAGIGLVVSVMVVICALVGTILGLLLMERNKAKKEFEKLSDEEKEDFIRHNQVLDRVNRMKNKNKSILSSTEVDF